MQSTVPYEVLEEISVATGNLEMIKKNKDQALVILFWLLHLLCVSFGLGSGLFLRKSGTQEARYYGER